MTKRKAEENIKKLTLPVSESRDHIQGPVTAPITLVEYGDYQCPYCAQAYMIVKEIQERLGSKLRPTFFINEDRYNGAWDLDSLLGALDEEGVFSWRQTY
jgi:protein-disulfide isomerase